MRKADWVSRYGVPLSPGEIKRLGRAEMVSVARSCWLLECLTEEEIEACSTGALRREIDRAVAWMGC